MNREVGLCGGSFIALAAILLVDVGTLVLVLHRSPLVVRARSRPLF